MSEWTPYQTDHLFLLVGTNPLPNYVTALLLVKDDGMIHLLHSGGERGTAGVADNLKQAIQRQRPQGKEPVVQEIDEADGGRIVRKMNDILKDIEGQRSVGLHYTGGTKAMAVHGYRAVEKKQLPDVIFSYLDARTLSLKFDKQGEVQTKSIPIERACKVKLDELVMLHGRTLKPWEKETSLHQMYSGLVNLHATSPEVWRKWCEEELRYPNNKEKIKSKTDLKSVPLPVDTPILASAFAGCESLHTLEQISLPQGWKIDKLAKWLDGEWLEHYVLDTMKQIADDCLIHDCGMNLRTIPEGQGFQFDVAAMRGYQLFALSCTTSANKGLCKHKLFESYIRARQMGGDEARVALVCCYQDPPALQKEIEESWFTEGRVRVFGRQHLPDLAIHMKAWFETANEAQ